MPLTWAEAVTADKVEVKESHIEELREGIDVTYDYAVDIDGRLGALKGRVDQHIGSVGLSNHGAASTGAAGFMTPTMVSQLAQLATYLNPDGTLNIQTEVTNIVNQPGVPSSATISGYFTVPFMGSFVNSGVTMGSMPPECKALYPRPDLLNYTFGAWGSARLPIPNGFSKENCSYTLVVTSSPVSPGGGGGESYIAMPDVPALYAISDYNLLAFAATNANCQPPFTVMYICTATR